MKRYIIVPLFFALTLPVLASALTIPARLKAPPLPGTSEKNPSVVTVRTLLARQATTTAVTTPTATTTVCSGPEAPIFVVMGQSNAWGLGKVSLATTSVGALSAAGWPFSFWESATAWANGSAIKTAQKVTFGPDLNIAYRLTSSGKTDFYIFKYAVSNTSLASNWGSRGTKGLYDKAVSSLTKAEGLICAAGKKPVVKAVFWMQGESDAQNQGMAAAYQKNLQRLVDQSRQDYLGPTNPFIIGLINNKWGMWPYAKAVRTAEENVGNEAFNGYVETNDLSVYPGKNCGMGICEEHYDTYGQLNLGNRFYEKYISLIGQ